MSMFDNSKVFGAVFLIAGLVAVSGAAAMFAGADSNGVRLTSAGVVLFGLIVAWSGVSAFRGSPDRGAELFGKCLMFIGAGVALVAVFETAGGYMEDPSGISEYITGFAISAIVGAAMIYGARKISAGDASSAGKASWIAAVIAVALCLLSSAAETAGGDLMMTAVCAGNTVMFLFLLLGMLTGSVRGRAGIKT